MPREDATETRRRLLGAAAEIFADKGYRDTTIAEICAKADANIASVNYHFRNKESLYREAWLQSLHESLKIYPIDGGVSDDASPEERLHGQIKALLNRIADENNKEFLIVQQEMASPTGLLMDVMREEIQPLKARMQAVIRELLGPQTSDSRIQFCEVSIISQCINPAVIRKRVKHQERKHDHPRIEDIEAYTDHVITFSLGGIHAILDKTKLKNRGITKKSNRGPNKQG